MATFVNGVEQAAAGAGGATTREGGQTTEATTTSTSATDLLSATSLTLAAAEPFKFSVVGRKTSGAAENAALGYKLNTTVIAEAVATSRHPYNTGTSNQAEDGGATVTVSSRVTNYTHSAVGLRQNSVSATDAGVSNGAVTDMNRSAPHPTVEITSLIMRGISDSASNTLGADELQVYSFSSS
jgi:hypothetical protein